MGEDGPWAAGEVWVQGELRVWFVLQGGKSYSLGLQAVPSWYWE